MKTQKNFGKLLIILVLCFVSAAANGGKTDASAENPRQRLLMDFDWRFHLGNASEQKKDFDFGDKWMFAKIKAPIKVLKADFNDSDWQSINLPHDWVVELPFDPNAEMSHGFKPAGRAYPENTIGWYRKNFDIPAEESGKRISLEFDGVFRDCYVWLNGFLLGRNQSGYNSFSYDITDDVNFGGTNTLVVRTDITNQEGWFYEGGGIYRHVWLVKSEPVHIAHWGTFVSADVKDSYADITARTKIVNESDQKENIILNSRIEDANGKIVAEIITAGNTIKPWEQSQFSCKFKIKKVNLWSLESPYLYKLVSIVKQNGKILDRYETPFGVRTIRFDADKGFFLNGKRIFIKGTCNHQDHAGVGSALPDNIQYYRIKKLKEMGCNAYRTSHNPPTPELLEACDRLGMLVMDETRTMGSSSEVLGQLETMVLRDRNHPCIIMWSLGNEEGAIQGNSFGLRIGKTMARTIKNLDTTRPITMAMNGGYGKGGMSDVVDIQGFNYRHNFVDGSRKEYPDKPIIMAEDASTLCTRGIYQSDETKGYISAYDANAPRWGYTAMDCFKFYEQRPWIMGTFIWTGFDYRGEPNPYNWPCISSHFGILDTCGYPKDNFYFYQAWWSDKTVLHIMPHWNWTGKEGQDIDVRCFTNCREVELLLNGKSLGKKTIERYEAQWKVKYEPGTLLAKGYRDGKEIAQAKVETTGAPAKISLTADCPSIKADGRDTAVVRVEIRDSQDRLCPLADNLVEFEINDKGKIIGVGNGNPSSHEADKASARKAFNGLCQVIIQAKMNPGDIKLSAKSNGLTEAIINLKALQCRGANVSK